MTKAAGEPASADAPPPPARTHRPGKGFTVALIIFLLCLAAALGTAGYLILRRLFWGVWAGWRQGRREAEEDLRRAQHTQEQRREALDSVLAQIGRSDDERRKAA